MSTTSSHYTARLTITRTDKITERESGRYSGQDKVSRSGEPVELGAITLRTDDLPSLERRVTAAVSLMTITEESTP